MLQQDMSFKRCYAEWWLLPASVRMLPSWLRQGLQHEIPRGWEARVDRNTFTAFFVNHENQVRAKKEGGAGREGGREGGTMTHTW